MTEQFSEPSKQRNDKLSDEEVEDGRAGEESNVGEPTSEEEGGAEGDDTDAEGTGHGDAEQVCNLAFLPTLSPACGLILFH